MATQWLRIALVLSVAAQFQAAGQQTNLTGRPTLVVKMGGTSSIEGVAGSPDGKWFVSQAHTGAVTIWSSPEVSDYRTFQPVARDDLTYVLTSQLAVAADSKTIAVANGADIHLFDVNTTNELRHFARRGSGLELAAHPKQMLLAGFDLQGNVFIISLDDGHEVFYTNRPALAVPQGWGPGSLPVFRRVFFSPNGNLIAFADSHKFEVWDWAAKRQVLSFDAHANHRPNLSRSVTLETGGEAKQSSAEEQNYYWLMGASFSPDGRHAALASRDELTVFDIVSGAKSVFSGFGDKTISASFFLDDDRILVGHDDQSLSVFSLKMASVQGNVPRVSLRDYIALPASGLAIINNEVLMDAKTFKPIKSLRSESQAPTYLAFTPDASRVLVGNWFKSLAAWNLESGEALPLPGLDVMPQPSLSGSGQYLISDDAVANKILIYDLSANHAETPIATRGFYASKLSLSSDGSVVAASQSTGPVNVYSVKEKRNIISFVADHPKDVAVSPDGTHFAVVERQRTAIYSVASPAQPIATLPFEPHQEVFELHFSPGGQWLGLQEIGHIRLLSTDTWNTAKVVERADCFEFSPDSKRIAYLQGSDGIHNDNIGVRVSEIEAPSTTGSSDPAQNNHQTASVSLQAIRPQFCPMAFSADGKVLAAATEYGADLFSTRTGELLASAYLSGGEKELDWLVVTPDGLFDGTPSTWRRLGWRFPGEPTFSVRPIELFFRGFYRPGLLGDILAGKRLQADMEIGKVDIRQPTVGLRTSHKLPELVSDRAVDLELDVSELMGAGARDLRLFRNGTLVWAEHGDVALNQQGKAAFTAHVRITAGENHFVAYVFNRGDVKSADAKLDITGAQTLKRNGIAYVVAMGVNHYAAHTVERPLDLQYAEADAEEFAKEFRAAQSSLHQYAQIRVIPLLGENATEGNLSLTLRLLSGDKSVQLSAGQQAVLSGIAPVEPEDGFFFFYAGHGTAKGGRFYLIPQDYNPLAALDDQASHTVSDLGLSQLLEGISPGRSFIIIDACNSGQATMSSNPVGPMNSTGLAQLAYEKGFYIMAASKDSESAMEGKSLGGGHGYLTYALIEEGLKQGLAAANGVIELRPWLAYASRRVPLLESEQLNGRSPQSLYKGNKTGQHPRVFYRREPDVQPFIIAKPRVSAAESR